MVKVSLIVTNYNYGKYLPQALESALGQDYPEEDLEIILIDDASTDKATQRFVEEYAHPRVKKILLKENVGVVRARNIAIEQAKGDYIIPLDADDRFTPDYVRLAAELLNKYPDVGLTYAYGELFGDAEGRWLEDFDMENILLEGGTPCCSMYRKSVWKAVGGYHDYMYHGWEDWDFWLSVLSCGYKIQSVEGTVGFYYRIKKHSRTKDQAEKDLKILWQNLFLHNRAFYYRYPKIMTRILNEAGCGRILRDSLEYRTGKFLTKFLRKLPIPIMSIYHKFFKRRKEYD